MASPEDRVTSRILLQTLGKIWPGHIQGTHDAHSCPWDQSSFLSSLDGSFSLVSIIISNTEACCKNNYRLSTSVEEVGWECGSSFTSWRNNSGTWYPFACALTSAPTQSLEPQREEGGPVTLLYCKSLASLRQRTDPGGEYFTSFLKRDIILQLQV